MTELIEAAAHRTGRAGPGRRLAIVTSMVLAIGAGAAALFLDRMVDRQLADIANTYDVRRHARDLTISVIDAETGQRGYLLTLDRSYLAPYTRAIAAMDQTYRKLLDLVIDQPSQHLRLEELADELEAKRQEMARTVELASAGNGEQAIALVRDGRGEQLMDTIRTTLRAFIAEEDARLIDRNAQMQAYRQWLVGAILAALGSASILAYALFARTQRQVAKLSERENLLLVENEQLEGHIRARTAEVEEAREHAERERARLETLLQDTNHRIGNSLATVSSLLGLQLARSRSEEVRTALEAAQGRVHAIAASHRRLRLGADLDTTAAAEFLDTVIKDLAQSVPADRGVAFHGDFDPMVIPARDATTIGILASELVTNAIKHAFRSGGGNIWVRFGKQGDTPTLSVEDDGSGMSAAPSGHTGLGAVIIQQLARQFGGSVSYAARPGGGTSVVVSLPQLQVAPQE